MGSVKALGALGALGHSEGRQRGRMAGTVVAVGIGSGKVL